MTIHSDYDFSNDAEAAELGDGDPDAQLIGADGPPIIRLPNGSLRLVPPEWKATYDGLTSERQKIEFQKRHFPTCGDVRVGARPAYVPFQLGNKQNVLNMRSDLAAKWEALTPAQQHSYLWRALRNRGTLNRRTPPCLPR